MSEYIFRDASGYGGKPGEYERNNNIDHYGTLHDEIVRCRDCKFAITTDDDEHLLCTFWVDRYGQDAFPCVEPYGFCYWGGRI